VSTSDYGQLGERLRAMADDLSASAERLQRTAEYAQATTYEAASADGIVEVVADGRGRLTGMRLTGRLGAMDPDELSSTLAGAMNEALGQARAGSRTALLEALPERIRGDVQAAVDDARPEENR
jgi:DNA-binding protein YbaB